MAPSTPRGSSHCIYQGQSILSPYNGYSIITSFGFEKANNRIEILHNVFRHFNQNSTAENGLGNHMNRGGVAKNMNSEAAPMMKMIEKHKSPLIFKIKHDNLIKKRR